MAVEYGFGQEDDDQTPEKPSLNMSSVYGEDKENNTTNKAVHKGMIISEVVDLYPDTIPLLIENGMHCIGCGASMFETLEEGLMGHGMDDKEIERIVDDLNTYIKQNSESK